MVSSRTFDGRIQLLEYVPTVLAGPPGGTGSCANPLGLSSICPGLGGSFDARLNDLQPKRRGQSDSGQARAVWVHY
jgi:hypothetical protein